MDLTKLGFSVAGCVKGPSQLAPEELLPGFYVGPRVEGPKV